MLKKLIAVRFRRRLGVRGTLWCMILAAGMPAVVSADQEDRPRPRAPDSAQVVPPEPAAQPPARSAPFLEALPAEAPKAVAKRIGPPRRAAKTDEKVVLGFDDVPVDARYDKVLSVGVLEHMTNLPAQVARAAMHLEPEGDFLAGIPSEGGLLWWIGWRCTTGLAYWWQHGLDYGSLMRHEHVNRCREIIAICRHLFAKVEVNWFPFPGLHVSFYAFLHASNPSEERCRDILLNGQ